MQNTNIHENQAEKFDRIEVPSAYQMVAEAIEAKIVSGRLTPGDEIGTEAELGRQFGVNRSTVREGIRILQQGGLVLRGAGRKLFVCEPRHSALTSRMSRTLVLREVTFRELFDTAMILELGAVEGAIAHFDAKAIKALEQNQARLVGAVANPTILSEIDSEFHALLAKASNNRVLELAREPAALLFFPTAELVCRRVPEGAPRMVEAHRNILDAIKARDLDLAKLWMRRHLCDWRKGFERTGRNLNEPVGRIFGALGTRF
jgi:GntR family transcriptional repressor for pyruvate dehydrogenase complex